MVARVSRVFVLYNSHPGPEDESASWDECLSLGRSLSASPLWQLVPEATLIARRYPVPLLAAVGVFDEAEAVRLEALQWQLDQLAPRVRYVSYEQAEDDCRALAEQLVGSFGVARLSEFRFVAIPRGGFFVLGMLAYTLGLTSAQLGAESNGSTLVVVDDCALSGERFRQFLSTRSEESVVFAHLYSHPDLRHAIEAAEDRVLSAVSPHDLEDHAPDALGDDYTKWKARWEERDGAGYWVGRPGPVVFAWNEPDVSIWNPITEQSEPGWRILPPELVLKNRPAVGQEYERLQIQAAPVGRIRSHPDVVYGMVDGAIVAANIGSGETMVLDEVGSSMWLALVESGDVDAVVACLVDQFETDELTVRRDLEELTAALERGGFLVGVSGPGPAGE